MGETLINIKNEDLGHVFGTDLVTPRELIDTVKDLLVELDSMEEQYKEKIEELERKHQENIEDFYNPKSPYEVYGLNPDSFH